MTLFSPKLMINIKIKLKLFLKYIFKKILFWVFHILKKFIKKKNYIIIQSYSTMSYSENSRYLFEYMSKYQSNKFKIFWNTESADITKFLVKQKLNYINLKQNPFKFLYIFLSCKILIDCGTKFLNFLGLAENDKKILKISIYHGGGPKTLPISKELTKKRQDDIDDHNSFNYINFPSKFLKEKCEKNFNLDSKKTIFLGFPRCDQFFSKKNSNVFNYLTGKNKQQSKIILYTPTWRGYDYEFPLNHMIGLNYVNFNNFLKKNNLYFFFSCHPNQVDKRIPVNFDRIRFINVKKYPFYDTNLFLNEVDFLLNDYSASSTDFAILKKPQIFFMPDYNKYLNHQGFLEHYKKNLIGPQIKSFIELKKMIIELKKTPSFYSKNYNYKLKRYLEKYYDVKLKNSSKLLSNFILSKI